MILMEKKRKLVYHIYTVFMCYIIKYFLDRKDFPFQQGTDKN